MPKIGSPKRIRKEDVKPEYGDLVDAIGSVVNDFNDQVYNALNGNLDFSNLAQQLVTLDLTTNAAGMLVNAPLIKYTVVGAKYRGSNVINTQNLINSNIYPTSAVQLSTTINNNLVTILSQTGLPANSTFRLTVILIGG